GRRPTGPGQHGHQGDHDHADQRVLAVDAGARVLQRVEVADDLIQADRLRLRHGSPSGGPGNTSGVRYTKGAAQATAYPDCPKYALALTAGFLQFRVEEHFGPFLVGAALLKRFWFKRPAEVAPVPDGPVHDDAAVVA